MTFSFLLQDFKKIYQFLPPTLNSYLLCTDMTLNEDIGNILHNRVKFGTVQLILVKQGTNFNFVALPYSTSFRAWALGIALGQFLGLRPYFILYSSSRPNTDTVYSLGSILICKLPRDCIVSVLWREEGYTVKYSLSPKKILRAEPKGFSKCLTVLETSLDTAACLSLLARR